MSKIKPDRSGDDENALIAQLRAELETLKAQKARSEKRPGWYERTVKTEGKKNPGRYHAERILPDRSVVSFFVGFNGKLTIGSHYGTYGVTAWADDGAVFDYMADDGPDGFRADRARVAASGKWSARPADGE